MGVVLAGNLTDTSGGDYSGIKQFVSSMPVGWLRALHAAVLAPAVHPTVNNFEYNAIEFESATGFLPVPAEVEHTAALVPVGATDAVIEVPVTVARNEFITLTALGNLTEQSSPNAFQVLPFKSTAQNPAAGFGHVEFYHAVVYAPAVNVIVNNTVPLFEDIDYATASDFAPAPAAAHQLNITVAADDTSVASFPATVPDQSVLTIAAIGSLNSDFAPFVFNNEQQLVAADLIDLAAMVVRTSLSGATQPPDASTDVGTGTTDDDQVGTGTTDGEETTVESGDMTTAGEPGNEEMPMDGATSVALSCATLAVSIFVAAQ